MNDILNDDLVCYSNLMMNLTAGLLPENLTENEVRLIERVYGTKIGVKEPDWFVRFGYDKKGYNRSKYDRYYSSQERTEESGDCLYG